MYICAPPQHRDRGREGGRAGGREGEREGGTETGPSLFLFLSHFSSFCRAALPLPYVTAHGGWLGAKTKCCTDWGSLGAKTESTTRRNVPVTL
jgi:hypothetical protein